MDEQTRIVSDKERDIYLAGAIEAERTYKKQLAEARAKLDQLHAKNVQLGFANRQLVSSLKRIHQIYTTDKEQNRFSYRERDTVIAQLSRDALEAAEKEVQR